MEQIPLWAMLLAQVVITALVGFIVALLVIRRNKTFGQGREEATFQTLHLAHRTLPFLRQGLNKTTAEKTAEIIYRYMQAEAISISNGDEILSYIGVGHNHHSQSTAHNLQVNREVLKTGRTRVAHGKSDIGCKFPLWDCQLISSVSAPLKIQKNTVGVLTLLYSDNPSLTAGKIKIATGLAQLMSTQMELSELDRKTERLAKAELQALQSQISPHFVYNTLNTIASFIRTRPETARELIVQFAEFTRRTFKKHGEYSTFAEELEYVHQYLSFEKARFGDRLTVVYRVDPEVLPTVVPVLILQPLVENAVRHGIGKKVGPGKVIVSAEDHGAECIISVIDDGIGMTQEELREAIKRRTGINYGVGLSNVNERVKSIYGLENALQIETKPGEGTKITFRVPKYKSGIVVS
ncbi:MAG: histidine kinase [Chloroflexi bacterium]|uniref:histidine kinase n=1 Tax=Candidatus Chlorohelix allophototropha TaxID=3003348 RepID=A0A8T7LXR3_9CHLR|nr:histidine kinase [Chloroflexota bacterium]WJW66903.1 histidine kinase [Chloroflexota bacterium L227-S17]